MRFLLRGRHAPSEVVAERDTDRDWQLIGEQEPYFGVLTDPRFRRANLDAAMLADFYASGRADIDFHLARMRELFGAFEPCSALDFGCGVGRLTRALAAVTGDATGVDVSSGMLAEARRYEGDDARFIEAIPDRTFDWVVSLIVLQHIPPARGYGLIRDLLRAVAPGGGITLQVTFARAEIHAGSAGGRLLVGDDDVRVEAGGGDVALVPAGEMIMYDYDLSRVIALFFAHGMTRVQLDHTDHGGAIGATLHARRG